MTGSWGTGRVGFSTTEKFLEDYDVPIIKVTINDRHHIVCFTFAVILWVGANLSIAEP